jgi:hypothetical protein
MSHRWTMRAAGKLPVVAIAKGAIEPLGDGEPSRVTSVLEFEARGSAGYWCRS